MPSPRSARPHSKVAERVAFRSVDGLKLAEGPRDVARIAVLSEKKGSKTRAVLKTLGRGAILLSVASFNLALWMIGAVLTLFGFVYSTKSAVERATWRGIQRRKERRLQRQLDLAVQARA